jgi:hypothetical protein
MAAPDTSTTAVSANPNCTWVEWQAESPDEVAHLVEAFEPLDTPAGHKATSWLKSKARKDLFTVTHLLISDKRVEGFITCRVSEATLTWSGIEALGVSREQGRKQVPAYLLCWCAKHRNAQIRGEELILNAIRLGREVQRYGCVVLALDPHDDECAEKVWRQKHGFREGAAPDAGATAGPVAESYRRLWTPLSAG